MYVCAGCRYNDVIITVYVCMFVQDVDTMMSSVEEMLKEIKNNQNGFDKFWRVHRCRVEHMMSMCHFTRSGEKVRGGR